VETYGYGIIFSLAGYLGVNAVLSQVKLFGALTAVTGMHLLNAFFIPTKRGQFWSAVVFGAPYNEPFK